MDTRVRNYVNQETLITADDLNAIQDAIIENSTSIGTQATQISGKADATALTAETTAREEAVSAEATARAAADTALTEEVNDVKSAISDLENDIQPINLFNKTGWEQGILNLADLPSGTGAFTPGAQNTGASGYIEVEQGKQYCCKVNTSYYGGQANRVCLYDENKTFLGVTYGTVTDSINVFRAYKSNTTGIRYVRFVINPLQKETGMMVEGNVYPTNYIPYGVKLLDESFDLNERQKATAIAAIQSGFEINQLYGKKAAFTGDSICYGAGFSGGYPSIIGNNNAMIVSNTGQTGATLASGTTVDGVNRGWICNKVANMPANYDYYIVEGGVNDAALDVGVQLGELTSGYSDTLDTTTLYGAVESICKTLQTTFIGKKYGFLIPHNCYAWTHRWNTSFRDAIKKACEKWGIPVLDLSENTVELNNLSELRPYTNNSDGWHPTEDGYKLFYVPKIEAWMKTL